MLLKMLSFYFFLFAHLFYKKDTYYMPRYTFFFKNPARGLEIDMEVLHSTPTETLGSHSLSFSILSPEEHGTADRDDAVSPEGNF